MKQILLLTLIISMPLTVWADHNEGHVDVKVGKLSPQAENGQIAFNENCAQCHGINGQGTTAGPPLIHDIYNPGHHNADSFYNAVTNGVKQHHWPYGDMPPQDDVGFMQMSTIMAFIRELQEQNGIVTREHKM